MQLADKPRLVTAFSYGFSQPFVAARLARTLVTLNYAFAFRASRRRAFAAAVFRIIVLVPFSFPTISFD